MAWVGGAHHVLGVPHLLCQLRHRQRAVLLAAARGQRGEAHHEEVQAGEGDQVHGQLAQVRVQLACSQHDSKLSSALPMHSCSSNHDGSCFGKHACLLGSCFAHCRTLPEVVKICA